MAVARPSSGGAAICDVSLLPVLWMTSRLAAMGRMAYFIPTPGAEFDVYECLVDLEAHTALARARYTCSLTRLVSSNARIHTDSPK